MKQQYLGTAKTAEVELVKMGMALTTELQKHLGPDGSIHKSVVSLLSSVTEEYANFFDELFDLDENGNMQASGPNVSVFNISGANDPMAVAAEVGRILDRRFGLSAGG